MLGTSRMKSTGLWICWLLRYVVDAHVYSSNAKCQHFAISTFARVEKRPSGGQARQLQVRLCKLVVNKKGSWTFMSERRYLIELHLAL